MKQYILGMTVLMSCFALPMSVLAEQADTGKTAKIDVLDLKNMDVLDVLKLISQKSGWNIVAGQSVQGTVTVYLKDVSVEDALTIIADAYGWAYVSDGGIIKVMTAPEYEQKYGQQFGQEFSTKIKQLSFASAADLSAVLTQVKSSQGKIIADPNSNTLIMLDLPDKIAEMEAIIAQIDVPVQTKVFDLSYAKAEDLSGKIAEIITPTIGKMKFDERSNKLVVSDTKNKLEEIARVIEAFDSNEREVHIEAKIIQITLNDEHKLGVDWEAIVSDYHRLNLKSDFDILQSTDKRGQASVGTLAQDDYQALLEALDTVGMTDILSSPSITTLNNKEAKILVGSNEPYVTTTTTTPASGPTTTAETVEFVEVGVKLFVTPTIHNDDFITMKIKPEVSSVTRTLATSNNNTIPIVETSEAETTVVVKHGVTIVIGGLIKEEKSKNTKKIPLLGDIPLLGMAFRSDTDEINKTELVIFLTPQIITGDISANPDAG